MAWSIWDCAILASFLVLIFYYFKQSNVYLQKKGLKTMKAYPIVGNMWKVLLRRVHLAHMVDRVYKTFPNEKYVGFYQFRRPVVIVRDIDAIKNITIKDFDYFQDRQNVVDEKIDPLMGKNLLSLKGQRWRDMRATLSPAFTSSKMKNMYGFIADCGRDMAEHYAQRIDRMPLNKNGLLEIEMKDAFSRYANDVIATTAFGIRVDSLKEQENEFFRMGTQLTKFDGLQVLKFLAMTAVPRLMKLLKITAFSEKTQNFFRSIIIGQMKEREEKNIVRQDMIHLLMDAKKGTLKHEKVDNSVEGFATVNESSLGQRVVARKLDDDDIVAQAILFFFGGFDTTSTLLGFLAHELALNPDVRKKLQLEIDELKEKNNGDFQYSEIQNMKYMDMVVSETLRKWPPGFVMERLCVKPYTLPPSAPNGRPIQLNAEDGIWIPVYSIHRDPQYYEDPDRFDPERFSDENKTSIMPGTYNPFGSGPRNCIGSRFALLEIKSVIIHLLANFDFEPTSKTANPLQLAKSAMNLNPEGGFWIGLRQRNRW